MVGCCPMSRDQIRAAAMALPLEQRAALAVELLSTIDGESDADAAAAWDDELDRRSERADRGDATAARAEDVLARARRLIR